MEIIVAIAALSLSAIALVISVWGFVKARKARQRAENAAREAELHRQRAERARDRAREAYQRGIEFKNNKSQN